ncbi:MAG: putative molybdenum carrier protein [Verrucomicrobiae bacterium]|nr:putative molybdenum carrier protein [Verrucomicrobiae bacterium]
MIEKIVSGGQTGADRAALDFAIAHGIAHGGWCPRGRLAEDGVIGPQYNLTETPLAETAQRTELNVRDSDATVIFSIGRVLTGGSKFTAECAARYNKPCLHVSKALDGEKAATKLREFLERHPIKCLNVAGPRASNEPEVGSFVQAVLEACLDLFKRQR